METGLTKHNFTVDSRSKCRSRTAKIQYEDVDIDLPSVDESEVWDSPDGKVIKLLIYEFLLVFNDSAVVVGGHWVKWKTRSAEYGKCGV